MAEIFMINRRKFLQTGALFAGSLLIPFNVSARKNAISQFKADDLSPNSFLRISPDGTVTVILSHCEMGQGIWTGLCMLIAEDLDADWSKIKAEHAPAAIEYYHTIYATQRTGGSSSLLSEFDRYRIVGATARAMLMKAAANRLHVSFSDCSTDNGFVLAKGEKLGYGDLVGEAILLDIPEQVTLKDPKAWKFIGKPIKRLDSAVKSNGTAEFGMDIRIPGALTTLVCRNAIEGARVKSMDSDAALGVPGVRKVVQIPNGVAVLADNFWAAKKGRAALDLQWDLGLNYDISSNALLEDFKSRADGVGLIATEAGNPTEVLKNSHRVIEAEYFQPFIAHAPMEPLNVTVRLTSEKCEIWTGTQTQTDDQRAASEITGLPIEKVEIHTPFLGGSFGRRNITRSDFVREAVEVAKASGEIVKTVWTREDDIQGGMYRPAFLHRFRIGLNAEGDIQAWDQISVGQSVMTGGPFEKLVVVNGVDQFSIEGMQEAAHVAALKHKKIALNTPVLPITVDNWRAVGLSHTVFAMESLSDELAVASGIDPLQYRLKLYRDDLRLVGAIKLAAEKSGWGKKMPKNRGMGIAAFRAVGSFTALIAEVTVGNDSVVRVDRVTCAIDCGLAINPDAIHAQMESSVAYGISSALYSEITFENGKVQQHNFYDYKSLRINEMPVVETHIVSSTEPPGGIGEAAVSQMMPALTNAIFAATGTRIRNLPIAGQKLV